ncbi:MAG: hypothetical protein M3448_02145 [Pseudomonadota bacterium]|nr:hypothetical protein [Sphingomonas sp.]MDQ3482199.1 hypothetical protein [Pseudomonadota bacterium]
MSKNQNHHLDDAPQRAANQKNQMSEDPKDGNRTSFTLGKDGTSEADEKPEHDQQDQETIEAFGERGVESSDKEG